MTRLADKCAESGKMQLVVSSGHEQVSASWFSPEFWGEAATPVSAGGRGGAWFIDSNTSELVLRHYRRGGLVSSLAEKTYLFTGFQRTRSLAEFHLLEKLSALALPVPEPVAAIAWKHGVLWYRAAILVKRIPGAVTLSEATGLDCASLWANVGQVIRQFHDEGLHHVDLNCDNILVTDKQIYLIDFDRCSLKSGAQNNPDAEWKQRNLDRLYRSVVKRCAKLDVKKRAVCWDALLNGYRSAPRRQNEDRNPDA